MRQKSVDKQLRYGNMYYIHSYLQKNMLSKKTGGLHEE